MHLACAESVVMHGMAIKAQLQHTQTRCATELSVDHGKQMIPVMKALTTLVSVVSLDATIEHRTRKTL